MPTTDGYQSELYGAFVQAIMYGIYVTTSIHCLRWLLFDDEGWKLRKRIDWSMLFVSFSLFLLSTMNLAFVIKLLNDSNDLEAVIKDNRTIGPVENATRLIIDGVLIYRCWMVYSKLWRVILLPIVLWLGSLVCAILIRISFYGPNSPYSVLLQRLYVIATFYACHIVINLYATSLIVYRILRAAHDIRTIGHVGHLHRAARFIAESGFLYTSTSILNLVGSWSSNYTFGEVADAINFSMAGIAFNLILIRVGQNRSNVDESRPGTQRVIREGQLSTLQFNSFSATPQGRPESLTGVQGDIQS